MLQIIATAGTRDVFNEVVATLQQHSSITPLPENSASEQADNYFEVISEVAFKRFCRPCESFSRDYLLCNASINVTAVIKTGIDP